MHVNNVQELAMEFVNKRSEASFAALYKRLKPGLLYHAVNILKDEDAAEDVLSEAFTKMWKKIDQYKPFWKFSTWAYRVVHNESMQYLRKKPNVVSLSAGYESTMTDDVTYSEPTITNQQLVEEPDWTVDNTMDIHEIVYDLVLEEIKNLPDNYKDIMIDRELNHMKYEAIAAKYDIKLNSVKTRIRRARTMIKDKVEEITGEKITLYNE